MLDYKSFVELIKNGNRFVYYDGFNNVYRLYKFASESSAFTERAYFESIGSQKVFGYHYLYDLYINKELPLVDESM